MKLSRKQCAKTIARNVYEHDKETNYIYSCFTTDKLIGMYELLSDNGINISCKMEYDIITVTFRECDKVRKYEFTIEEVKYGVRARETAVIDAIWRCTEDDY